MIIDTESPEGRALVALAQVGMSYLHTPRHDRTIELAARLGLVTYRGMQWNLTELAKLPEGLWPSTTLTR